MGTSLAPVIGYETRGEARQGSRMPAASPSARWRSSSKLLEAGHARETSFSIPASMTEPDSGGSQGNPERHGDRRDGGEEHDDQRPAPIQDSGARPRARRRGDASSCHPPQPVTGVSSPRTRLCLRGKSASFVRHVCVDVGGTPLEGRLPRGTELRRRPAGRRPSTASPTRSGSTRSPRRPAGRTAQGRVLSTTCKRLIDEYSAADRAADEDRTGLSPRGLFQPRLRSRARSRSAGHRDRRASDSSFRRHRRRHDYLFLATGTGIAPFRGMVHDLLEGPDRRRARAMIHLVMGAPYTSDLLYHDVLPVPSPSEHPGLPLSHR